ANCSGVPDCCRPGQNRQPTVPGVKGTAPLTSTSTADDRHSVAGSRPTAAQTASELVGSVQLDVDWTDRLASLGYGFKRSPCGNGLATEAAAAIVSTLSKV